MRKPDRPRSDALRNKERVLSAAAAVFARDGLSATVQDVAEVAGVGVGTVYRGFGTKTGLVDAVYASRMEGLLATLDVLTDEKRSATETLALVLRTVLDAQLRDRGLQDLFTASTYAQVKQFQQRIAPRLDALIAGAKEEGGLWPDFEATDVPAIIMSCLALSRRGGSLGSRLAFRHLEFVIAGVFGPKMASSAPAALTDAEYATWSRAAAADWIPDMTPSVAPEGNPAV